jgi:pyruvate dehydrogenase E2 component (dihydrolipoamide acetyltransferase)
MAIPVIMPKQGQSVETCIITRWFKCKGDKVSSGDLLFSYETDKAAFELESPANGTLLETFFDDGAEVPVLVNVAVIGLPGESIASFIPGAPAVKKEKPQSSSKSEPAEIKAGSVVSSVMSSPDSRIKISPRAKKLAESKGVIYGSLNGSGPNGRIVISDIEAAIAGSSALPETAAADNVEFTEKPISNVRKLIAKAMHTSLQSSAQLTHHMSADVRGLLQARQKIKKGIESGTEIQDITLNDMVCWCVIKALRKFQEVNAHFLGDTIKTFNRVHLGMAVDTPRGLMVPALKNADGMSLPQLSKELKQIAESCRKGNINPELIQSTAASFTVSNLGNYGVEMFTPVINLPQAAILGVCNIINRPVDLGNSTFGFVPYIGLSLTYDHRAIDGGPATLFLKEIKEQIENFSYSKE